jgi:hypothetical protein
VATAIKENDAPNAMNQCVKIAPEKQKMESAVIVARKVIEMNGTIKQATATRMLCGIRNTNEATPKSFYDQLNAEFAFDYDPCPLNPTPTTNGLIETWGKRVYVNPPYGKEIRKWIEKAQEEIVKGNTEIAVFLLPAYTDVKWFHEIVLPTGEIRFIKGRLKFGEHNNTAPFASMIVIFRKAVQVKE